MHQPTSNTVPAGWHALPRPHDQVRVKIERSATGAIGYSARGLPQNLVAAGIARAEWITPLPKGKRAPADPTGGGYQWRARGPKLKRWMIERDFPSFTAAQGMPGVPTDINAIALEVTIEATATPLPRMRAALVRRYPGIKIDICELRHYSDGSCGSTVSFHGAWEIFVKYGLAMPTEGAFDADDEFGARRSGSNYSGGHSHLVIHSYDDDPKLSHGTFPTRKVEVEVQRMLNRIGAKRSNP
jgi:hypothetical protein